MKKFVLPALLILIVMASCELSMRDQHMVDITLPKTYTPSKLVGEWGSGYNNLSEVIDAYNGRHSGNSWQSGQYFKITDDGRNSEFYHMAQTQYTSSATRAIGTIRFDAGSTADSGAFTFLALKAHFNGWGSVQVNREAGETELKGDLSQKYDYRMENGYLLIEPRNQPGTVASGFKRL